MSYYTANHQIKILSEKNIYQIRKVHILMGIICSNTREGSVHNFHIIIIHNKDKNTINHELHN